MLEAHLRIEPNVAEGDLFLRLRSDLDLEIANYVYKLPENALGSPLPAETISKYLEAMRRCLVVPHWEEVNICTPQQSITGTGVKRMCVTMAEDGNYVLIFDSFCEEYHLAWRGADGLGTWGISGAGVDCFIAR